MLSLLTICLARHNVFVRGSRPVSRQAFLFTQYLLKIFIPPANFVCGGYTVFTLFVRVSVRPSVTFCFLNILKSHCWIFIKPYKHVDICKTNTLDKKVRARGPRKLCGGYTVFTLSVRVCVRPSVTFCFLNILKSHCWIFIKPCKHVDICKTNTLNKKVRARGQFF